MADFRAALLGVLDNDRSRLCAAAEDDVALAALVERIAYVLQAEHGLVLEPAGQRAHRAITGLPLTRDVLLDLEPHHATHVASCVQSLLLREPWKSGLGWEAERLILGALYSDLHTFAKEAGEPEAEARDIRGQGAQADDRQLAMLRELQAEREAYADLGRQIDELPPLERPDPAPVPVTPAADPARDGAALAWI